MAPPFTHCLKTTRQLRGGSPNAQRPIVGGQGKENRTDTKATQIPRLGKGLWRSSLHRSEGACGARTRNDNKTKPRGGGNDDQRSKEIWQRKPDRNVLAASEQFTSQD